MGSWVWWARLNNTGQWVTVRSQWVTEGRVLHMSPFPVPTCRRCPLRCSRRCGPPLAVWRRWWVRSWTSLCRKAVPLTPTVPWWTRWPAPVCRWQPVGGRSLRGSSREYCRWAGMSGAQGDHENGLPVSLHSSPMSLHPSPHVMPSSPMPRPLPFAGSGEDARQARVRPGPAALMVGASCARADAALPLLPGQAGW